MIYYIADPHFGHSDIIHRCDRPFETVGEMDRVLIENWNSRVRSMDEVYVLGDMFYDGEPEQVEEILKQLRGRKHLITGNHDGSWLAKIDAGAYFETVDQITEVTDGQRAIMLCHYPIFSLRPQKKNYMIYGHVHNDTEADFWPLIMARERMLNAGVEINHYMPVTFEELVANNAAFQKEHGKSDEDKGGPIS